MSALENRTTLDILNKNNLNQGIDSKIDGRTGGVKRTKSLNKLVTTGTTSSLLEQKRK